MSLHPYGDASVVTLVVTMTFKPEHDQDFVNLARAFVAKVHALEPDTLLYALTKHPTEPHTYVWVERYRNLAALEAHGGSPHMAEVFPSVERWLAKPPEMLQLAQVAPL